MNNKSLYHKKYLKYKKKYLNLIGGSLIDIDKQLPTLDDVTNQNNIIMWGDQDKEQHKKFPETELSNIKYVSCGSYHNVGLKNDNTVITWGNNRLGQYNLPKYLKVEKIHDLKKSNFKISDDKLSFTIDLPSKYIFETLYGSTVKDISNQNNFTTEDLSSWDNFQIALDKKLTRPIRNNEEVILYSNPDIKIGNIYRNKNGIFETPKWIVFETDKPIVSSENDNIIPNDNTIPNDNIIPNDNTLVNIEPIVISDIKDKKLNSDNIKPIFPITIQMITTTHINKNFQIRFTDKYEELIELELINNKAVIEKTTEKDKNINKNTEKDKNIDKNTEKDNNNSVDQSPDSSESSSESSSSDSSVYQNNNTLSLNTKYILNNINKHGGVQLDLSKDTPLIVNRKTFKSTVPINIPKGVNTAWLSENLVFDNITAITCGSSHSVALKMDGRAFTWGSNIYDQYETFEDVDLVDIIDIKCGQGHSVALKDDGTVITWGNNEYGQRNIPSDTKLVNIKSIACGFNHTIGLKHDGTIVSWGNNDNGQQVFMEDVKLENIKKIFCGGFHNVAIKEDDTVIAWGSNEFDQCDLPIYGELKNVIDVACGRFHNVALKKDGTCVIWGNKSFEQDITYNQKLENIKSINCGENHSVALRNDGSVIIWGGKEKNQLNVPSDIKLDNIQFIVCGDDHTIAIQKS